MSHGVELFSYFLCDVNTARKDIKILHLSPSMTVAEIALSPRLSSLTQWKESDYKGWLIVVSNAVKAIECVLCSDTLAAKSH